jgi:BNR repeat-like domain
MLCSALVITVYGGTALAQKAVSRGNGDQHFTKQARIGFRSGDDWEPSITHDHFGHLYAMYKHYDVQGGQTCQGCGLHMVFQRSDDSGITWSEPRAVAPGPIKGKSGQDDPQIVVDPVDGRTVWASFMQNFPNAQIEIVKSTDFGATWSAPRIVDNLPPGLDKDELVVRENEVVVGYDDGTNTWASISLDGGEHWQTHEIFPTSFRFGQSLAAGGGIDSHGNIYFSWNSFDQAHMKKGNGPVTLWISKSSDNGVHWTRTIFGVSGAPAPCHPCGFSYFSAQDAISIGSDDTIYLLWNSSVSETNFAPERIYFARSTDGGRTFSPRMDVSDAPQGVEHCFPAIITGKQAGNVRLAWMDTRTGAWTLFYRTSLDGGMHLSPTIRISGYVPGYSYVTKKGFNLPYGDYYQMTVDEENHTHVAFGEGPNYQGPGNIWVSNSIDN